MKQAKVTIIVEPQLKDIFRDVQKYFLKRHQNTFDVCCTYYSPYFFNNLTFNFLSHGLLICIVLFSDFISLYLPLAGFEPAIPGFGNRCLIH